MCDQDHFEKDRQEYEARALVTRRQFGVLLGAGLAALRYTTRLVDARWGAIQTDLLAKQP